jgi:hypothetical protein
MSTSSVRLYVILARKSPLAVVFRRGPSKQVLLLLWNTATDKIMSGQWFKGRIYERRCDLSPSADRLIYFAAKHRPPFGTWTAVSRPPYLTALALWPKGDAWGGGGLFSNENTIQLNHPAYQRAMSPESRLPKTIVVEPFGPRPGGGEDDPILSARLIRDGWELCDPGVSGKHSSKEPMAWTFSKHQLWRKTRGHWSLEMRLLGVKERDGPWYVLEHQLLDADSNVAMDFGRSDWADWSRQGDILLARDGRLFRLDVRRERVGELHETADLRALHFKNVEAPVEATRWRGPVRVKQ